MKNLCRIILLSGIPALLVAEKTPEELQIELNLATAKLAVAEAKLALAASEAALAKLALPKTDPGTTGSQDHVKNPPGDKSTGTTSSGADSGESQTVLPKWPSGATGGPDIFFHTGARVLTPYKIDYATHKISSESTEVGGFLEVVAPNLWAWKPDFVAQSRTYAENARLEKIRGDPKNPAGPELTAKLVQAAFKPYAWQSLKSMDFSEGWDYLARLSFEFGSDKEASAATITGSGDVGAEVGFSKHLFRGWTPSGAWSVGLGGGISAVTDRRARKVHNTIFTGITTVSSFNTGGQDKPLALLRFGIGYANIEGVLYDDPTANTIRFDGDVPHFESKWRPAATAELWWPMAKGGYLTAGARVYSHSKPDQWTLYLGTSIDIPNAISSLSPKKADDKTK